MSIPAEQPCDCPACTGKYTPAHLEHTRESIKQGIAAKKVIFNHLHGADGELFTPVGFSVLAGHTVSPLVPNILIEMLDINVQFDIFNNLINAFKKGQLVACPGLEIPGTYTNLSVPIRMIKVDETKAPEYVKTFLDLAYENHPREVMYQLIFPDSAGKFPDQFGFNHAQMAWNKPMGDL